MKILVALKRVADTDQKLRIAADGRSIDVDGVSHIINPFDAIALEEAVRLRQSFGADVEIVVVTIGVDACEKEIRTALAVGADRGILVSCSEDLDPWNVSRVLEAVVQSESPGLVVMGKQAVDDDSNQTGQFLAARLGWPQATFASKVECVGDGLRVARESDVGVETVSVPLPAVVTCDLRLNEPRYASLPAILKAKKKPIDVKTLADLDVAVEPRIEILRIEHVDTARRCVFVENVDELISRLRSSAKILA